MPDQQWCDWHVITIEDFEGGEREYTVLHPEGCSVRWSSREGVRYECWVAWELENSGWIAYFDPQKVSPGWYRIRGRTYELRLPQATEWDSEAEAEKIRWFEMKTEHEIKTGEIYAEDPELPPTDHD